MSGKARSARDTLVLKLGKLVVPPWCKGQGAHPANGEGRQGAVEVGEELASSGRLPLQRLSKRIRGNGEYYQTVLPRPVLGNALLYLVGRGEVNEAVAQIIIGAAVGSAFTGGRPAFGGTYVVDRLCHGVKE